MRAYSATRARWQHYWYILPFMYRPIQIKLKWLRFIIEYSVTKHTGITVE